MRKESITQKRLKELFNYDHKSGEIVRIKTVATNAKAGDTAGCINGDGYLTIWIDKVNCLAHHVAWFYFYGEWPIQLDHINHDRTDNKIINLRTANKSINGRNQSMRCTNKSGVMGVNWHKMANKWRAFIRNDGKNIHLGTFDKFNDAVIARKKAEYKYGYHVNHGN